MDLNKYPGLELHNITPEQAIAYVKSVHAWLDNQDQTKPEVQRLQQLTDALLHAIYGDS